MKPALVILAAGMGSRYGGLKQIDGVGSNNEPIIEYTIYDAKEAGFEKVYLIIRKEHESLFDEALVNKVRKHIEVEYVYQDLTDLPKGYSVPENREKPWGTTHALLACRNQVKEPFMICNADDYYGKEAFKVMYDFLTSEVSDTNFSMVGYLLENTLTDNGTVSRGVCVVENDYLKDVVERLKIKQVDGVTKYFDNDEKGVVIPENSYVSMNYWGFSPKVFAYFEPLFEQFLKEKVAENPMKAECLLPSSVDILIKNGIAKVKVLRSSSRWYGVTYREDKPNVVAALDSFRKQGLYPEHLWD